MFPDRIMLHRDSEAVFGAGDGAVERVALEGNAAGLGDEAAKLFARHALGGGGAGVVVDLLLDHGAVKIVGAEAERDLRDLGRHHLPVGLDVREVVEQQAADGDLANVGEAGGDRQVVERRVFRMKGERDEGLEAAGFVLEGAQLEQVIHAVGVVLNVAVEHGRVGLEAEFVGRARGFKPLLAIDLVVADDGAHAGGKDLRAAAGHGVNARLAKLDERFVDG